MSIEDRLARLERETAEDRRPWYKRASDVFALFAIAVAVASVVISSMFQSQQTAGEDRRHLTAIFNEIGSVNAEIAALLALPTRPDQKEFAGYALNNQLWTLLQEADRLVKKFETELGPLELAVLGVSFAQIADLERAERYMAKFVGTNVSPLQRAIAHRSVGNFLVLKGKDSFATAHENYRQAIDALEGTTTLHAGRERVNIHVMQTRLKIAEHKLVEARASLNEAWSALRSLPCIEELADMAETLRRYAKVVQAPEPQPSEPCVFIDRLLRAASVDQFIGSFQAMDGKQAEVVFGGAQLQVHLPRQRYDLLEIREGMYELKGLPGYFVLFGEYRNKRFNSLTFYQPNGVFVAQRVLPERQ